MTLKRELLNLVLLGAHVPGFDPSLLVQAQYCVNARRFDEKLYSISRGCWLSFTFQFRACSPSAVLTSAVVAVVFLANICCCMCPTQQQKMLPFGVAFLFDQEICRFKMFPPYFLCVISNFNVMVSQLPSVFSAQLQTPPQVQL